MYAFRKPFASGSYSGLHVDLFGIGLDYKVVLVIAQIVGYCLSKFIGIKYVSEVAPSRRAKLILLYIGAAELALLGFALVPHPYGILFLFLNGLPLGMIWGLVFGFLEGRRLTEGLAAGLSASYILASGFVKAAGFSVLENGVSEQWMPFVTGMLFAPLLVVAVWLLSLVPPPSKEDEAHRVRRVPMDGATRRAFFARYSFGLVVLVFLFMFVTAYRDYRDNFAVDIWKVLRKPVAVEVYDDEPGHGPSTAPVTLVEFSNFTCGHCKGASESVDALVEEFGDDLRVVIKLRAWNPVARKAAVAALAANEQGKYLPMQKRLFSAPGAVKDSILIGYAQDIGLDIERFKRDMEQNRDRYHAQLARNEDEAKRYKSKGTPHFFINGTSYRGARPLAQLRATVKREAKRGKELIGNCSASTECTGVPPQRIYATLTGQDPEFSQRVKGIPPSILATTEMPVALGVILALGLMLWVRRNRRAFFVFHVMMMLGTGMIGAATLAFQLGLIPDVVWFVLIGLGCYLAYVPFGSVFFDRLLGAAGFLGTAGFMIYVTDAFGYLGSIGVLLYKEIGQPQVSGLNFFIGFSYLTSILCTVCFVISWVYFARKLKREEGDASQANANP